MICNMYIDGSGITRNPGVWVLEMPWKNGFLGKLDQAFSNFFAKIFGISDDFSKLCLKFEKSSNMIKNEAKSCSTCLL